MNQAPPDYEDEGGRVLVLGVLVHLWPVWGTLGVGFALVWLWG